MVSLLNRPEYYNNPYKGEEYTGTNFLGNPNFPQYSALQAGQNYYSALPNYKVKAYGVNTSTIPTQPKGYSSLGQQMNAMNLPMPSGSGKKTTGTKTPPNWRDNLLNYVLSPKGQGMAQGLLEASGYSETPISFGQALAMGLKRGNEAEATAAASQLAKDQFEYQKSQDLITNLLEQQKIKPQETFEQIEIEVPDGDGGTMKVQANRSLLTGKVTPVMSGSGTNIYTGGGQGGWKKVNETFGAEVQSWNLSGGYTKQLENLNKIDDVITTLKEENVTGSFTGIVPRVIRAFVNPESVGIEDDIRSIIFQSLRETLGAQFTEREGNRLVEASFNILLDEETNIKRLERLKSTILKMAQAKQKAADYFIQNNGDMTGYEFQTDFGFNDIKNELWNVEDYKDLSDTDLIKLFNEADKNEQNFIIKNAKEIGIKLDE